MAMATLTASPDAPPAPYLDADDRYRADGRSDLDSAHDAGEGGAADDRMPAEPSGCDPEARLRVAAAAGDRGAFAALYAAYRDSIYQYLVRRCRGDRHLAEDLTQDTFARALSSLARYRETGRPFGAWLVTIAGNLLTDYWRSGWHRYHIPWNDFTGDGSDGWLIVGDGADGDPATEVAASDRQRHLAQTLGRAIARLSDRQQQVVSLRYGGGLSVADTAQLLGLDEGAVKAATYRARQALACDPTVLACDRQLRS
jgi:RNA polymerase sigma-70 factor (ECF subfamily)